MFIQTLNFNRFFNVLRGLSHFRYLLLTLMIFASLFAGLWFLPQVSAQSESTMTFGYGNGLQFVDPDGQNSIPFWSEREYESINFSLFPLSDPDFLTRYKTYSPSNDPWGGSSPILDTTEITPTATWTMTVSAGGYYGSDGNFVTMPEETDAGIYIIQADAPNGEIANSIIVISRNVLVLKRGNNGQVVVWASTLQDGTPVADMEITLYNILNGEVIDQGNSDANGVVELNAGTVENVMVMGHKVASEADDGPTDITLASLENDWRVGDGYWWWWRPTEPEDYRLYLYTDRPIYRPGHTVYFDAIARNNNLDGFTPIAASTTMTATLRDVRKNLVDTLVLKADEYGTANGQFTLGDEISLGDYYVDIQVGEQTKRQRFMVEEYTKPEYSVQVSTPKSYAIEGDSVPVTVDSAYFFGQPVTDAKVTLKIYRQRLNRYYWWSYDEYYPSYWYGNELLDTQEGTTDSQGQWTMMLEPSTGGHKYGAKYTLIAEVTDAQEKTIQGQQSLKVFFNEFDLKLRTERYGYIINQPITVTLQTRNHDGTPHANQTVDVSVMSHRNENREAVQTLQAVTDGDGNATLTFEGVPHGWYYLTATATDSRDRKITQTRYLCIYDPDASSWWWWGNRGDQISILPDKESYAPGETAHLLIQSRIESGVGLLTLEREGVYDEILVNLDGPVTMVDVPITEEHGPNVFAKFHLFQKPSESTSIRNREGNLIITKDTEIVVELLDKKLELSVSADAEKYRPGQSAQLTLTLQDGDGQPTAGRVSVALVDEALFALQEDLSADLFATFYARGDNRVGTYHSLVRAPYWYGNMVPTSGEPLYLESEIAFGDDGSSQEDPDSAPRRNFQDTAYWNASIDVGADGTATITVPLPDNLTTWRITARAITKDTRIGTATEQLLVTKEIISRPTLPRFAVVGDRFSLRTVGQNYTGIDLQAEARLESNHLLILDPDPQTLDLPNTKSAVGQWTAVASHMGTGLVTSTLYTDQGQDIVELPLRTKAFSAPERWIAAGQANPEATETFTMSLNAIHDASELTLYLSPSIALGLLDGLDDLIAYPYGCVEQTMSRMLPSAVAVQVYNELKLENPKADEVPKIVSKGLQKLYGYQYDNGGWGWFYDDERGLYLTSYVLLGLTMVQDAGFDVDEDVLNRGFDALDNMLAGGVTASALSAEQRREAENDDMRAFALYVKALAGRGDGTATRQLAREAETLRTDSLAMLALALDLNGNPARAQELTDILLARVNEDSNDAYWHTNGSGRDWYYWRTMASRDKYTAIAVQALTTLRPDSPQLPKAVRWLMKNRRGASWRNTQATAFAVLGLMDYIQVSGELESDYRYTININDVEIANGQVTPATVTEPIEPIVIPGNALQIGENQLTIARSDQGGVVAASVDATNPLYYTAQMRQELYYDNFTEIESAQEGLTLSRSYRLIEGESRDDGTYNIGDVVEVTLGLEIDDEVWYLLVEDPIPAGFEVLNERLNQTTFNTGSPYRYWWRSWGYNRKDIRDDRVDFFITRGYPGTRSFTYLMRATVPGTFSVLPGQAYPMYDDDMWARTASTQVTIAPEELEPRPALLGDFDNDCRITEFDALQATAEWGSDDAESDLIADGMVHLDDMAAAIQRQGSNCITAAGVSLRPATEDARFLLFVPDENTIVGEETRAYIMVENVDDLGGFEFTLNYNQQVLRVKNVLLGDGMSKDVRQLGPTTDNQTGQVTFGALDMAAAYGNQQSRSQIQQVIASARASTNMANLRILSTVVFQAVGTGSTAIQVGDAQAMDSDGLMLAATVDSDHQPIVGVDVGYFYLPLVMQ